MAGGQISFASFATPNDRGSFGWRRAAAAVRDHAGAEHPAESACRAYWRLHAPNYRELARSVRLYEAPSDARAHVAGIAGEVSHLRLTTFVVTAVRSSGWYITLDDEPIVMCARWYQSTAVAAQAGERSLKAFIEVVSAPRGEMEAPRARPVLAPSVEFGATGVSGVG